MSVNIENDKQKSASSSSATGNPRNKVALKPGHSLMDWIRLGKSGKDLTGVGGIFHNVTMQELSKHNSREDAWISIDGAVYNVTAYMDFHPGGVEQLMLGVGKDATKLFKDTHSWVNYNSILQYCIVGRLKKSFEYCPESTNSMLQQLKLNKISNSESINSKSKTCKHQTANGTTMTLNQSLQIIRIIFKLSSTYQFSSLYLINSRQLSVNIFFSEFIENYNVKFMNDLSWPPKNFFCLTNPNEVIIEMPKLCNTVWTDINTKFEDILLDNNIRFSYFSFSVVYSTFVSHDTKLLILNCSNNYIFIPIGFHINVLVKVNENEIIRPYTPVPVALLKHYVPEEWSEDCLCFIIKEYSMGLVSPVLCNFQPSDTVRISYPEGSFCVDHLKEFSYLYLFAAGSGLTPMLSIIHWAFNNNYKNYKVKLMFFNKSELDIIWKDQLQDYATQISEFEFVNILSQPDEKWNGYRGRINHQLLTELIPNVDENSYNFVCGPIQFVDVTRSLLQEIGYTERQFFCF